MIVATLVLVCLVVIALTTVAAVALIRRAGSQRDERARIESEQRRAEYRLHRLASDAFTHMMDVARDHGFPVQE